MNPTISRILFSVFVFTTFISHLEAESAAVPTPRVLQAGLVAPNILGITIEDGTLIRGGQAPYAQEPGDTVKVPDSTYTPMNTPQLWRKGAFVGWLLEDGKTIGYPDQTEGFLASTEWLEQASSFTIQASGDPRFAQGGHPTKVFRKSMPHTTARRVTSVPLAKPGSVHHTVYLQLAEPWTRGVEYQISFPTDLLPLNVTISDRLESEAIHVNQVGFHPLDEPKVAFLSCWLGTGGAVPRTDTTPFHLLDAAGQEVFRGNGTITTRAQDNESLPNQPRNLNLTDVVLMDFTSVKTPGTYRLVVPGIGSSYPIVIAEDVWSNTFTHVMKGFYHQRSGLELKPPYTNFHRPRNMHPADGVKIFQSTCTLMDSRNGLDARGTDGNNFENLVKGGTDEQLGPEAWGGYADAGDWDRRIQHLEASRLQLDLLLEGGEQVAQVQLSIPENTNQLPDVLDEVLWNLDFYRRIMTPAGGVRGGIESEEHPKDGEGSWQESWTRYAYAPDVWSSYLFSASAARCAHYADGKYPEVTELYRAAGLKAMAWAEAELARLPADYLAFKSRYGVNAALIAKVRSLAAADLYRLTGDKKWHDLFLETFNARHEEAAWAYLQTRRERDPAMVERCQKQLIRSAETILNEQQKVGFRWSRRGPGDELWKWGLFSRPEGGDILVRAWRLTGEPRFRQGMVLAAQMGLGANPNNVVYTSGLGRNPMRNVFYHDTLCLGLESPDGLVAFGPVNPDTPASSMFSQIKSVSAFFVPAYTEWPQTEFCLDTGRVHMIDEHTPDGSTGQAAYLWGSLAH